MSSPSKKKKVESRGEKKRREAERTRQNGFIILAVVVAIVVVAIAFVFVHGNSVRNSSTTTTNGTIVISNPSNKPVILYVDQGNAVVNRTNFPALLNFAKAQGFNTIFFQIYRGGQLLFDSSDLSYFVESAHLDRINFYYALYFTNASQTIPTSIYNLGENGISLDMSTLPDSVQSSLLATLQLDIINGTTAVTSTNLTTTLKPDLLVLETYNFQADEQYIHSGIIASVEPLSIPTAQDFAQEVKYSLSNSGGVMVFDYYGMLKMGY
jgi:hypothetical protein